MRKLIAVPYIKQNRCFGCVGGVYICPADEDRPHSVPSCFVGGMEPEHHRFVYIEDTDAGRTKYIADKLTGEPDEPDED